MKDNDFKKQSILTFTICLNPFYKVTGIKTAVYDSGFNEILAFPGRTAKSAVRRRKSVPAAVRKAIRRCLKSVRSPAASL